MMMMMIIPNNVYIQDNYRPFFIIIGFYCTSNVCILPSFFACYCMTCAKINSIHPVYFSIVRKQRWRWKRLEKWKKKKQKTTFSLKKYKERYGVCMCVFMPLNWVEWIERKIIISKAKQQWWWKTIESKASDYWLKWETNKQTMNVTEFVWSRIPISILLLMAVNSASAAAAVFDTYVNQTLNSHTISFSVQILEPVLLDYYYENTSHP